MSRLSISIHPKLTDSTVFNLKNKKIYTAFDFVKSDSEKLMQHSGLSFQDILEIKQKITKLCGGRIRNGRELLNTNYNNVILTGIKNLDDLLKGGLRGGHIYEICGLSSSGKSQLCHTIAVNIAQKLEGIVHYIDTKGDFCALRAQMILENKKCSEELGLASLNHINVIRAKSAAELVNFLHSLKKLKREDAEKPIKLVIIDSVPAIFFNSESAELLRSSYTCGLNHLSNVMRCVANELNTVFITINLITKWQDWNSGFGSDNPSTVRVALGKYWLSIPNTRLLLETTDPGIIKISLLKSSYLATGQSICYAEITNAGVV